MDESVELEQLAGARRVTVESREPLSIRISPDRSVSDAVRRALSRGGYAGGIVLGMAAFVALFFCGLGTTFLWSGSLVLLGIVVGTGAWIGVRSFAHQRPLVVGYRLSVDEGRFRLESDRSSTARTLLDVPVERLDMATADKVADDDTRSFCDGERRWVVTVGTDSEFVSVGHGLSEEAAQGLVDLIEALAARS